MRRRGGEKTAEEPPAYVPTKLPNPHRVGTAEWYLEERRRDGKPVNTKEDKDKRDAAQRSTRAALSDADIDRDELPDLAAVARRKAKAKESGGPDDHPPVWALCALVLCCIIWMIISEVLTHWWSHKGSFSLHFNAMRRHLEL